MRTPRRQRNAPEWQSQCDLFDFLRRWSYRVPEFRFVHGSMNGVPLTPLVMAKAAKSGLTAGVWDVTCLHKAEPYSGLLIEMKAGRNTLTPEQEAFGDYALSQGFRTAICYDWVTAARVLCTHLGVTDEAVWASIAINGKGPPYRSERTSAAKKAIQQP